MIIMNICIDFKMHRAFFHAIVHLINPPILRWYHQHAGAQLRPATAEWFCKVNLEAWGFSSASNLLSWRGGRDVESWSWGSPYSKSRRQFSLRREGGEEETGGREYKMPRKTKASPLE